MKLIDKKGVIVKFNLPEGDIANETTLAKSGFGMSSSFLKEQTNSKEKKRCPMNLPEGISVERTLKNGKVAYRIQSQDGQELGGLIVSGTTHGDTHLEPYLSDGHTSYSQNEIEQLVADITRQMTDALIKHEASKPYYLRKDVTPPVNLPEGVQALENKYIPCSKCNSIIARLIFSWDSQSEDEMLEMGGKFSLECRSLDYPVWVLGAPDSQDDSIAKHLTLKLAPELSDVY